MYIYVPPWRPFRWLRWCKGITQKLLHRGARTHRRVYNTAASTQRSLHTQKLLYRGAFTHRRFYTENLLHREAFTHRRVYAQKVLHTEAFTQAAFYTENPCHKGPLQRWLTVRNRNFTPVFFGLTLISCERVASEISKSQFYIRFLTLDPNVVRKGNADTHKNRISPRVVLDTHDPCRVAPDWQNSHFAIGLCVRRARSLQRAATDEAEFAIHHTFVRHARSLQGVTFCKPVFGCPCRLKREFRKTSEVGVP